MFTLIFVLFGIIAVLAFVAFLIEYFPGRTRRRNRGSGTFWEAPYLIDNDPPDFSHDDNDGGWFDGGDVDVD
ncbi:hypothetical protein C5Y96_18250 [Blastopirellula marina]|uniref:Uncharacterized protein n=1 Tax=Blastopirellula marina TaxID=124 RepID=A0A2S8F5N8_9BACT|nr:MULTISPECIES: hypothetical protein [Pirellulaceae]PQO27478.1 hypothetical protein C5Y96_18250 [Blastopirellula marina]RCS48015.1 hypothetical protein DTL36_18275 [Bremerella cremea]